MEEQTNEQPIDSTRLRGPVGEERTADDSTADSIRSSSRHQQQRQQQRRLAECQMRATEFAGSICRRRRRKPSNDKKLVSSDGLFGVGALLVCIFASVLVVRANHLHQSVLADSPPRNLSPPAGAMGDEDIDKERIQLRHNFAFTVNGRELALQPPQATTAPARRESPAEWRVRRVGDAPIDYESGFEPSDSDQSASGFEQTAPASHSSALMSSAPNPNLELGANSLDKDSKGFDLDRETPNKDKSWRSVGGGSRQTKQSAENDSKQSRIISDWPKNVAGREHSANSPSGAPQMSADRHSSWSQNNNNNSITGSNRRQQQLNSQLGPKYSALLSSKANSAAANELASQSGEPSQPRWDNSNSKQLLTGEQSQPITGRIKLTISSKLAQTIKQPAATQSAAAQKLDDSSAADQSSPKSAAAGKTNKRGSSSRKRQTIRAPVHARQRFSSPGAGDKSADEPELSSQREQPGGARSEPRLNTTPGEPLPVPITSEHKTNFTATASATDATKSNRIRRGDESSKRTPEIKSSIVQRDLSRALQQQQQQPMGQATSVRFRFTGDGQTFPAMAVLSPPTPPVAGMRSSNSTTSEQQAETTIQRADSGIEQPKIAGRSDERMGSIVRTGPILPPHSHLSALVPAAMALLAQANDDKHSRSAALRFLQQQQPQVQNVAMSPHGGFVWPQQLGESAARSSVGPTTTTTGSSNESAQLFGVEHMIATANHLGVAHLQPQAGGQTQPPPGLGLGESGNYGPMSDYTDRVAADANMQGSYDAGQPASSSAGVQSQSGNSVSADDQRYPYSSDYPTDSDQSMLRPASPQQQQLSPNQNLPSDQQNSRSSMSDSHYMRAEHKAARESPGSYSSVRGSIDPFEDLTGGLSASDYERDLADLDEEFSRHTTSAHRRPSSPLMSDSYVSLSPERYEARRYNRRPSYDYGAGEYLSTAGSMSNIIPRAYARSPVPWAASSPYSESSDLWSDSGLEYSPMMSPSHYAYRWRPRYQRITTGYPGSAYLTAAASEQQLQPGYSILPAAATYPSNAGVQPTETISFALSPLAAAAAAAASALAAADKSRHQSHAWLTLPRLTTTAAASQPSLSAVAPTATASASASNQHASTVPASFPAATYLAPPRPGAAYAFSPIPIYAFAPRPQSSPALAAAGSGAATTPAMIPYFHGATPTLLAYRTAGMLPASSLLTAASFAYPFRMPMTATTLTRPPIPIGNSARPLTGSSRPYFTDLQFAETKYKLNPNNSSSDTKSGFAKSSSTLSAMAKNLTKKVFGSASQLRPQHVAPPTNSGFELYSSAPSSALANLNQSIIK